MRARRILQVSGRLVTTTPDLHSHVRTARYQQEPAWTEDYRTHFLRVTGQRLNQCPVCTSETLTVPSSNPEASRSPSGLKANVSAPLVSVRARTTIPVCTSVTNTPPARKLST